MMSINGKIAIGTILAITLGIALVFYGCLPRLHKKEETIPEEKPAPKFSVFFITDGGIIKDSSFNQAASDGLKLVASALELAVTEIESAAGDCAANVSKAIDQNPNIILGIGFRFGEIMSKASIENPKQQFVLLDFTPDQDLPNLLTISFRDQESAFLIGVLSALETKTGNVAFIGGMKCPVVDRFACGFNAGVAWANKQFEKSVKVNVQYIGNFGDLAKAADIAANQHAVGCDIFYAVAGAAGIGALDATKNWKETRFMGVDQDQSPLAPESILGSSIKNVGGVVVEIVTTTYNNGSLAPRGGHENRGLKDGGVGIVMTQLVSAKNQTEVNAVRKQIIDGEITVPENPEQLAEFLKSI